MKKRKGNILSNIKQCFHQCFFFFYNLRVKSLKNFSIHHFIGFFNFLSFLQYVLLMSEGLMVLMSENIWSRQLTTYRTRSHVHWCLQMLGASFSIAGTFIMYRVKKQHFTSIHGILGITSVSIMIYLGFTGISVFYAYKLREFLKPFLTKGIHNFLGIACFVIGIVSQCYGYNKNWMVKKSGQEIATLCIVLTGISTLICLYRPILSLYRQVRSLLH